mmetsp:Transcript_27807/g.77980  ORF Transcript_27807/g.77980 Transcript_27807/m.77980 type:complete len:316 (+) Transcript_27807:59-1006(+)
MPPFAAAGRKASAFSGPCRRPQLKQTEAKRRVRAKTTRPGPRRARRRHGSVDSDGCSWRRMVFPPRATRRPAGPLCLPRATWRPPRRCSRRAPRVRRADSAPRRRAPRSRSPRPARRRPPRPAPPWRGGAGRGPRRRRAAPRRGRGGGETRAPPGRPRGQRLPHGHGGAAGHHFQPLVQLGHVSIETVADGVLDVLQPQLHHHHRDPVVLSLRLRQRPDELVVAERAGVVCVHEAEHDLQIALLDAHIAHHLLHDVVLVAFEELFHVDGATAVGVQSLHNIDPLPERHFHSLPLLLRLVFLRRLPSLGGLVHDHR